MYRTIWIGLILTGCGSKMDEATVKGVVEAAFQEHNSTNGRYGWELAGKGQWFDGTAFDKECLIENELAYPNHSKIGQISPAYDVQHMITSSTKRGYCLDMGEGLSYVVDSITHVSESGSMDIQNVALRFEIKDPSPWFSCLKEEAKSRTVRVENLDGTPKLNANDTVTFQEKNGCGNPVPKAEKRNPTARPTAEPTSKPTIEEVRSLAQKFDDALFERDFDKAYGLVSCVNLYENSKWGTCSLAEVLALGPSTHGESRAEDGAPWLEYTLYDLSKLEKVVTDKQDPTLYHVLMTHRKTKQKRSLSVQWANGRWKLFGVVSIMGAGLTPLRLMNDLHDKNNRDIFERRLGGEQIDYRGNLLDPNAEEEE